MNLKELSKEISYALRHAPWEYELELDEEGFVPIEQLIHALNEGGSYDRPVTKEDQDLLPGQCRVPGQQDYHRLRAGGHQ